MATNNQVSHSAAYVLHSRPYRESSAIVEIFSEDHGRGSLVARGVKRPRCRYRGLLQPFQPLLVSWSGQGELATLTAAEEAGPPLPLTGQRLVVGLYINELLMRALQRGDGHNRLYRRYHDVLHRLATHASLRLTPQQEADLRLFELDLLTELGYGLLLDHEADSGAMVVAEQRYHYHPSRGPLLIDDRPSSFSVAEIEVPGKVLLGLAARDLLSCDGLQLAKRLLRRALAYHFGDKPLRSRRLFQSYRSAIKHDSHEVVNDISF